MIFATAEVIPFTFLLLLMLAFRAAAQATQCYRVLTRYKGDDNSFGARCLPPHRSPETFYINHLAHTLPRVLWGAGPGARMSSADTV